jgi:hypothetical protein
MRSLPPSVRLLEIYAMGSGALAFVLLIALLVHRNRRCREPRPIPEYAIVHTPMSRLKNMAWTIATTVAGLLVSRWLTGDGRADRIIDLMSGACGVLPNALGC